MEVEKCKQMRIDIFESSINLYRTIAEADSELDEDDDAISEEVEDSRVPAPHAVAVEDGVRQWEIEQMTPAVR